MQLPSETFSMLLQPIESISIAEVRKNDVTQRPLDITHSSSSGLSDTTTSSPAAAAQQLAQLSTAAAGIPGYALWLQLQYQQALGKLSANDQAVAPYPMDTTHPDLVPTPCSPSMHSTTGSYTDISSAYLQSPGTTDAHHFDAASQPTAMNMPGWGGMPMASAAAGHMPSFAPQFPSICDQSLMASRAPLGGVQLLNSLTFGQTPLSGAAELGLSPAWGLNYSMPPQYHGKCWCSPMMAT